MYVHVPKQCLCRSLWEIQSLKVVRPKSPKQLKTFLCTLQIWPGLQVHSAQTDLQHLLKTQPRDLRFLPVSPFCHLYMSHRSVYLQMTESCSTSHSLIVWTQEAKRPYRGQTHKAVLAVGWRGMRKCMCVCVERGEEEGGGGGGGGGRHFLLFFCC